MHFFALGEQIFSRELILKRRPHVCDTMQYHLHTIIMKRVASSSDPIRTATKIHMLNMPSGLAMTFEKMNISIRHRWRSYVKAALIFCQKPTCHCENPGKFTDTDFEGTSLPWEVSYVNASVILICWYFIYQESLYDFWYEWDPTNKDDRSFLYRKG